MRDEHMLDIALAKLNGKARANFDWGTVTVEFSSLNLSAGGRGSPDALVLINLEFDLLGEPVSVQVPVLVEAEKAGLESAIEDLDKFTNRSLNGEPSYLKLPMLVATRSTSRRSRTEFRDIQALFNLSTIPLSRLDNVS